MGIARGHRLFQIVPENEGSRGRFNGNFGLWKDRIPPFDHILGKLKRKKVYQFYIKPTVVVLYTQLLQQLISFAYVK